MKAAIIRATGGPEVLELTEVPTPEPQPGQVRVRIRASAINPIDTYIRSGMVALSLPLPAILGCDFAGEVDAVGEGVTQFQVGQRVWGSNQGLAGRSGTLCEYACIGTEWVYPTPDAIRDRDMAALALVGITAHLGLFACANLQPGETVFVNGGTGGVGSMVVQMAKAAGAAVITSVGSSEKAKLARELGADEVILYKEENIYQGVASRTGGKGVSVWYETQREPDLLQTVPVMQPRGRIILMAGRQSQATLPVGPFYVKNLAILGFAMFNFTAQEQRLCADQIQTWIREGKLKALVGLELPLEQAAEGHRVQEANSMQKAGTLSGKIVIIP
ncbi:NADPH:quinone reductase [Tuwongella immobilis]|uniref:Enoyl reductase (ER) domain-containing protein n=1 Tax=Tuwongella immobilis TaxID=692036 RepID=A0A6C2YMC4_9BACT|nr:NADPH:quinone reductase [Tuwongella immobilis]VIP02507.1 quinone oxidoreductase : NADPH2:quinone reductase OS=uncultured planctomycete GN=HGMM_F14B06C16 PE=4 SV=1: ADH_N: ADH_zinc_N [Tuwongella immobilis]VTS01609.1 quinone oxidoreductase : NADPH2:quinone reductase OS=uncultured planctomycete GN=HGMM_F14B06C16 PE=4 SV=1: ADH_N: ADH_zinc_N [Tuwongella immobilis]